MSKENFKIYACIVLFGLVGICIKLGTAVSSEIKNERNINVKVQNFVQNSTMPKDDLKTIKLSAADSNLYHVMHRVGNKADKIGFVNPHTHPGFALEAIKKDIKVPKDIDRILADLEEMTKRAQRHYYNNM